jgi:alkanesulfonate monooxygenase SsuD/methylene tetrahydromethanopterin reductase-like flavin-dependent oxidoreductase (luciferase family)
VILGVGVGAIATDLPDTGEVTDIRGRAERLDDGIDLMRALWAGSTSYHGPHYDYETARDDLNRACQPVQERIPVWVVGVWPRPKSMRRVLRCDGIIPQFEVEGREAGPDDARAALERCDWNARAAVLHLTAGLSPSQAAASAACYPTLRAAMEEFSPR